MIYLESYVELPTHITFVINSARINNRASNIKTKPDHIQYGRVFILSLLSSD